MINVKYERTVKEFRDFLATYPDEAKLIFSSNCEKHDGRILVGWEIDPVTEQEDPRSNTVCVLVD